MGAGSQVAGRSKWGALLALVLLVVLWWFTSGENPQDSSPGGGSPAPTATASSSPTGSPSSSTGAGAASSSPVPKPPQRSTQPATPRAVTDEDGFRWVEVADLPDPAEEVLAAIDAGGPFEYAGKDGSTFGNFEGVLPRRNRGYYREYTVDTPGLGHRGARRIVTGRDGQYYWTADHYESFERIRR